MDGFFSLFILLKNCAKLKLKIIKYIISADSILIYSRLNHSVILFRSTIKQNVWWNRIIDLRTKSHTQINVLEKMYRQLAAAVADEKEITKLKMKLSNTNDVYLWLMVLGSSIPFRCHQNYHPIEMNAKHSLLLPLTYRVMALWIRCFDFDFDRK